MVPDDLLWMKDFLQDDLYLLETDKTNTPTTVVIIEEKTPEPSFNCLGRQGSGLLILVHYTDDEHMDAFHLTSLENILSRKNVKMDEVVILNIAKQTVKEHAAILNYFKPEKMLIMGKDAFPAGLAVPELNVITDGNVKLLYTFSFDEMDSDEKKRMFWNQMKNF